MPNPAFVVHMIDLTASGDRSLQDALSAEGFAVYARPADPGHRSLPAEAHPDLILLSLARDGSRGLALCRHLRTAFPRCAMCLIHEGLGEWEESVALELGADVVIPRPAEVRRAVAQVRAFQRLKSLTPSLRFPRLQLLAGARAVRVNGDTIPLTDAEFDLLSVLAGRAGQAVSRDTICQETRGLAHEDRDRTIDLRIARIRQKLGDNPHQPVFIRTVRGEGYMLMVGEA